MMYAIAISLKPFTLIILASLSTLSAQRSQTNQQLIHRAFNAYKAAILRQDGDAAVVLVDRTTLEYYSRMKALALDGSESEVKQLTPMNKIMVLSLRHRVALDELRTMTAEALFIYAVNHGWIGKNSVLDTEIGEPRVFGTDASAEYIKNRVATSLKFRFKKELGKWKLDLTSLIPIADQGMTMLIQKQGFDEDAFIINLIESVSGKRVSASIWQPPGR